jgi:hypothetical protein
MWPTAHKNVTNPTEPSAQAMQVPRATVKAATAPSGTGSVATQSSCSHVKEQGSGSVSGAAKRHEHHWKIQGQNAHAKATVRGHCPATVPRCTLSVARSSSSSKSKARALWSSEEARAQSKARGQGLVWVSPTNT